MILAAHHALPEHERPVEPDMHAVNLEESGSLFNPARMAVGERRKGRRRHHQNG
ncbi:hypothetical protein OG462_42405 [Streptomyces sp. NBC_01077]|uniref:hypothetical protein n=1 Tax=Streptomyces sp. NBC_01077 TaxID=2903746 RepID=UPI003867D831|nr:hypothetical protein OG462_02615 [Streptomyces sp. NBC_01077]WSV43496.1 hypothetical protein OG462_42405 [Streptomyces sp. NBC_01077]